MKPISFTILILAIVVLFILWSTRAVCQQRGKLVKNQSVLAMTAQMDTLPLWMVIITNKNSCRSVVEFKLDDGKIDTVTLDFDEDQQMMIHGDFILEFRNSTPCDKGSTQWLYIDNNLSLRNPIQKSNENSNSLYSYPIINSSFIPLREGVLLRGLYWW